MLIRNLPGNHTEVFIAPDDLYQLARELHRWEHVHKYVTDGRVVNAQECNLTLRSGDNVIRFRLLEELDGIDPDPAVYHIGMEKGTGCQ